MPTCAGCKGAIVGVLTWSSIYGAENVLLCDFCTKAEEEIIEERGTNDIPWLLESYKLD